jgi:hypothetical protein
MPDCDQQQDFAADSLQRHANGPRFSGALVAGRQDMNVHESGMQRVQDPMML